MNSQNGDGDDDDFKPERKRYQKTMLHRPEQTRITIRKEEAKIRKNVVQVVINLTTFL